MKYSLRNLPNRWIYISVLTLALLSFSQTQSRAQSISDPRADCSLLKGPLVITFFVDKSGSTEANRTPWPTYETLLPLLQQVITHGGIMAVGITDEHSNESLLRLDVPMPASCPEEPDAHRNPFIENKNHRKYEREKLAYDEKEANRHYAINDKVLSFKQNVEALLALPRNARRTDIWGSIRRGELLQNEPSQFGDHLPRRYHILVSDGEHTAAEHQVVSAPLKSGAVLITVNGTPVDVELAKFDPVPFESLGSAISYIVNY